MKTRIKTATAIATLLAGAVATNAQPPEQFQRGPGRQAQTCPECGQACPGNQGPQQFRQGAPGRQGPNQFQGRRQGAQYAPQGPRQHYGQQQGFRGNYGPQRGQAFQGPRQNARQQRPYAGQWQQQAPRCQNQSQWAPQGRPGLAQNPAARQEVRERALERFDRDGDGQLNEKERKALKQAIRQHQRQRQDPAPKAPPAGDDAAE